MKRQPGFRNCANRIAAKVILVSLVVLLASVSAPAQKEANNWLFGGRVWLDFSTGVPVYKNGIAPQNLPMNINEGSAVMSDRDGNLLFYTEGKTLWNRNHTVMSNGDRSLLGETSSTQSAIIVPWPGKPQKYFVFTLDVGGDNSTNGLYYSVVDMDLAGGFGDVDPLTKNIFLQGPMAEKLAAVTDGSGTGYWVIAHGFTGTLNNDVNRTYFAYHITASGINTTPKLSTVGFAHESATQFGFPKLGQMKVSPDGTKIACAVNQSPGFVEILNFSTDSGAVSEPGTRLEAKDVSPQETFNPYGLEFSPDSKLLYVSTLTNRPNMLVQFDLHARKTTILYRQGEPWKDYDTGSLQLAPDHKIYMAWGDRNHIGVIKSPNTPGEDCKFEQVGVSLPPGSRSTLGLPAFITRPEACCDKLNVVPHPQENLSLDYRTFTITNLKAPASPICSVNISWTPAPPYTQGGDLYVDNVLVPTGTRFISPYNLIPNAGGPTISAMNTVKFNLGVDYTLNPPWSGTVTLTVNHCDGTKCTLSYEPWKAAKPQTNPNAGNSTFRNDGRFYNFNFQLKEGANKTEVKWISFLAPGSQGQIFAGSGSATREANERTSCDVTVEDCGLSRSSVLYAFTQPLKSDEVSGTFNLVLVRDPKAPDKPTIIWTTYDLKGNAIQTGTINSQRGKPQSTEPVVVIPRDQPVAKPSEPKPVKKPSEDKPGVTPAVWEAKLAPNVKAPSDFEIKNFCEQAQTFIVTPHNLPFLRFVTSTVTVRAGSRFKVPVVFDTTGMKPGVYEGHVAWFCETCKASKCKQVESQTLKVRLIVAIP